MALAHSKMTAQGQISVPARIRKRLGLGPGSVLEWDEQGDNIIVRRANTVTWAEIRRRLFPDGPPKARTLEELKEGIGEYIEEQHARGRY
jgi:AbrB family looped-hinge helix DNA binding protein